MNPKTFKQWRERVLARQDAQAVYWQGGWGVSHVHVREIKAMHIALLAQACPIASPGLVGDPRLYSSPIVAQWESFELVDDAWANRSGPWKLFFGAEVLRSTLAIVAKLPPGQNFVHDVYQTSIPDGEPIPFCRRSYPGPIFRELTDYLRECELRMFGWLNEEIAHS